jgi:beta-N-acetylhexosaminidase
VLAVGAGVIALASLGGDDDGRRRVAARESFLTRLIPPTPERVAGPRTPRSLGDLARRLPLEREVAQLFLFGFEGQDTSAPVFEQLRSLDLGGIVLEERNYVDPAQLAGLAGEAATIARAERHIPPWILVAQEGGEFSEFADLPPAKAPGELESPREAASAARETAAALEPLGVNGLLVPVVDVEDERGALEGRARSADPAEVSDFATATVRTLTRAGMLSAPRSFPGMGAASQTAEEGPASVGLSLEELERRDLAPFRAAIAAGAPAIVVGHGLYATDDFVTPASLSRTISSDLLRERLGFKGVAITDDLAAAAITAVTTIPQAAVAALRAGADLVYISGGAADQRAAYLAVVNAVRKGSLPRRRVDEALARGLIAKHSLGLIR